MTKHIENYENDMSELIQHEYDHLNGILAIDRAAANSKSFRWIVMPEKTGRITDKDLV
jgi:peptide deformylase